MPSREGYTNLQVDEIEFLESESASNNANAAMLLGNAAFEAANSLARSNPARAVTFYDKALKSRDDAADAIHFNRATCLVHLGRADDAIESLEQFLKRAPTNKQALTIVGNLKMQKKDYAGAAETLEKLPDDADACFKRGTALTLLVRVPEAKAMFKRMLELQPGHERAASALAGLNTAAVTEGMTAEDKVSIGKAAAKAKAIAMTSTLTEKKIEKMVRRKSISEDEYARPERPVTPPPEMDAPLEATPPELLGAPNSLGLPTVSLADIVARKNLPADFDVANTEKYLTDGEFVATFGMDYKTFSAMKKWKRNREKKKYGLF